MENQEERDMNYKGVSSNESFLLNLVKGNDLTVFGVNELHRLSGWEKRKIYNTLFSLTEKEQLVKIKRNHYALKKDLNEKLFEIATETVRPAYISFWTALSFYGFTDQQVKPIQLVSTKQEKKINFNSHSIEVTSFKPERFYGYNKRNGFVIAEKEKALIDSLYQLEKCGGFNEFVHCLKNAWKELSKKKFASYLLKFGNKSMISRAGYLLEKLKLKLPLNLRKYKAESFVRLNPQKEKTNDYNKKWGIIINQKIELEEVH